MTISFPELRLKSIGKNFRDKLITSIVKNCKYEDITSKHQREKGGNPRMLKNRKNKMLG